jgi:hypothetical protein
MYLNPQRVNKKTEMAAVSVLQANSEEHKVRQHDHVQNETISFHTTD